MAELKQFTHAVPRPLPIIVLADVSASMGEVVSGEYKRSGQTVVKDGRKWELVEGGVSRIKILNDAMREMILSFGDAEQMRAEVHVAVITFGVDVRTHIPLQPARAVKWSDMACDGDTPMGAALSAAADLIENHEAIPSRAYRPSVILVSDGVPTDNYKAGVARFIKPGRPQKADRVALAIGDGANELMLAEFLSDASRKVFHAEDAAKIRSFFRFVTMSVSSRSRSANPNDIPPAGDPFSLEQF